MDAMLTIRRSQFYGEACRLADKHDVPDHGRGEFISKACASMAHRAYLEEIAPFVEHKVWLASLFMGDVIVTKGGQLVRSPPKYPPDIEQGLAEMDKVITRIRDKYALELHVSVTNWPAPDVTSHGPAGSAQGISGSEQ